MTEAKSYLTQENQAADMSFNLLRENIHKMVGTRIFTIEYTKANNTSRHFRCQLGVRKHVKGTQTWSDPPHILKVYDLDKKSYRSLDLSRIVSVRCGNQALRVD